MKLFVHVIFATVTISSDLGFQKKKKKGTAGFCPSRSQTSLTAVTWSPLVESRRSIAHGGLSATQSSGGAGVRIQPGSPGRGTCCTCVTVAGACKQQSYSANANVVFTHCLSPSQRQRLAKINVFAEMNQDLKQLPSSHANQQNQSDPSRPGLQHSELCAVFCHVI